MSEIPLLGHTKSKILHHLKSGPKTAGDIGKLLDIQVSAARKHLESMQELNILREEFVHDGIGRPKKFYSLTEGGFELFPRQYGSVLSSVISQIVETRDTSYAQLLLSNVAQDVVRSLASNDECDENGRNKEKRGRIDGLVKRLNEFGFEAAVEKKRDGTILIESHNCPLHKVAARHPRILCEGLHSEIIRKAIGSNKVKLEKCVMFGDAACLHKISS